MNEGTPGSQDRILTWQTQHAFRAERGVEVRQFQPVSTQCMGQKYGRACRSQVRHTGGSRGFQADLRDLTVGGTTSSLAVRNSIDSMALASVSRRLRLSAISALLVAVVVQGQRGERGYVGAVWPLPSLVDLGDAHRRLPLVGDGPGHGFATLSARFEDALAGNSAALAAGPGCLKLTNLATVSLLALYVFRP